MSMQRAGGALEYLGNELNHLLQSVTYREFRTVRRPTRISESRNKETGK
jgi:hypothetical protein